tara:strand:+ start:2216 stop:2659 length:444 start_codon:yes stop_codon:yes gene_type:complete
MTITFSDIAKRQAREVVPQPSAKSNSNHSLYLRSTSHAKDRCKQRGICKKNLTIEDILKFPIYTKDSGCTKYLDIENNYVYYVRNDGFDKETNQKKYKIVTMIQTNPIQMLRYYAFGQKLDFRCLCRDNAFGTCRRGAKCRFIHING